jgi:hypothetical protein
MTTATATSVTTHLQWGAAVTAPSGAVAIEASRDHAAARVAVRMHNENRPGTAGLVYREITVDDEWLDTLDGEQYGVRYVWPDGHQEIRAVDTREHADAEVHSHEYRKAPSKARVVSRHFRTGDWLPVRTVR